MSEPTLDDLRVRIDEVTHVDGALIPGGPLDDTRPLTPVEFDLIATEQGYVKRPVCGTCERTPGRVRMVGGKVVSDALGWSNAESSVCPSCGGTGFGRLVALDGIDTDELRQGIEYHRKDYHSDPTLIQRYLALARQVLDALDGGQE